MLKQAILGHQQQMSLIKGSIVYDQWQMYIYNIK